MLKVLIADDEPKIRKGLKQLIDQSPYKFLIVAEAQNGQEALDLTYQTSPELFFVDINMPKINGLEFICKLKNISPNSIVVIITGYDDFEYAQKAIRYKVYDYLLKPVYRNDFHNLLKKIAKEYSFNNLHVDKSNIELELSCIVRSVKDYIDNHLQESRLDLTYIARLFNVDKSYISKKMKLELGRSFIEYLTEVRLESAKEILENEHHRITMYEVSTRVGYTSQHYFSRVFKKAYHISPLEYRSRYSRYTEDVE